VTGSIWCFVSAGVLGHPLFLPDGRIVILWPRPILTPLVAAIATLLSLYGWIWTRKLRARNSIAARIVQPLVFFPLTVLFFLFSPFITLKAAANLTLLVVAFLVSSFAGRAVEWWIKSNDIRGAVRITLIFIFASTMLFWLFGWHFTKQAGEHSGDEIHYIVQARSLHDDGDLDVENNCLTALERRAIPRHISPNARDDHWYSWHSFGIAAILAPTIGKGIWLRHLLLGLIAGLGCGGMLAYSLSCGASIKGALVVSSLFSLTALWAVYSSRALPETLGATLMLWLHVCILRQRRFPRTTAVGAAFCCCALPWMHTRFIPPVLLGFGFFCLVGLTSATPWRKRIVRLAAFAAAVSGGGLLYYCTMNRMFFHAIGYHTNIVFMSNPLGIWHALAGIRGILFSAPVFAWMLPATLISLFRDSRSRLAAFLSLLQLVAVLVVSCSTGFFHEGESLPGRFLLLVVPLLIGPATGVFERTSSRNRWWFVFLAMISTIPLLLMCSHLSVFGESFSYGTRVFHKVFPKLQGLIHPLQSAPQSWLHPFAIVLYVSTFLMLVFRSSLRLQTALPLLVLLAAIILPGTPVSIASAARRSVWNAEALALIGDRLEGVSVLPNPHLRGVSLKEVADLLAGADTKVTVTTGSRSENVPGRVISLRDVHPNDWLSRGMRWATLVKPFSTGKGLRYFQLTGKVEGNATPVLAIREGSFTHLEQEVRCGESNAVSIACTVRCRNAGDICILISLRDGEGAFHVESLGWSPYSHALLDGTGMELR